MPEQLIVKIGDGGSIESIFQNGIIREEIDALFNTLEAAPPGRITLYFHGGLNNESTGINIANTMIPHIQAANNIPIIFVWKTGIGETIGEWIRASTGIKAFNKVYRMVLRKLGGRLGNAEAGDERGSQIMSEEELELELEKEFPFDDLQPINSDERGMVETMDLEYFDEEKESADLKIEFSRMLEKEPADEEEMKQADQFTDQSGSDDERAIIVTSAALLKVLVQVSIKVLVRRVKKQYHGFYPTVMEEALRAIYAGHGGKFIWSQIKQKADEMWSTKNNEVTTAHYLLQRLANLQQKAPDTKINLAGHSAGSIAICRMLQHAGRDCSAMQFNHIIFLAPAVGCSVFYEEIIKAKNAIHSFRLFTMTDELEKKDKLFSPVYTRSLLYLVSGLFEETTSSPIAGMQKFLKGCQDRKDDPALDDIKTFLEEPGKNRVVYSLVGSGLPVGMQCAASKHGSFDEDMVTIESLKYIIAN